MKPNERDKDAVVSGVLRAWSPKAELPARFQAGVWRRIADADVAAGSGFWETIRQWLEVRVNRPAAAGVFVAALMGLGVTAGYWHARLDSAQTESALQARYLQSVDPFLPARP